MLSDTEIFMVGRDPSTYVHHFYKITFGSTTVTWANKKASWGPFWFISEWESLLNSDKSIIYSFYIHYSNYLYLVLFQNSNGDILSSNYKSSKSCSNPGVYGSAVSGDYVIANLYCTSASYLVIYNSVISTFVTKLFSGQVLYGWGIDPISGR